MATRPREYKKTSKITCYHIIPSQNTKICPYQCRKETGDGTAASSTCARGHITRRTVSNPSWLRPRMADARMTLEATKRLASIVTDGTDKANPISTYRHRGPCPKAIFSSVDILEDRIRPHHHTATRVAPRPCQIVSEEKVFDESKSANDSVHVPCAALFFFDCISWGETRIRSCRRASTARGRRPSTLSGPHPASCSARSCRTGPASPSGPPAHDRVGARVPSARPRWPKPAQQPTTSQTARRCRRKQLCEAIAGFSMSVSDSSSVVIASQTAALVGSCGDRAATLRSLIPTASTMILFAAGSLDVSPRLKTRALDFRLARPVLSLLLARSRGLYQV